MSIKMKWAFILLLMRINLIYQICYSRSSNRINGGNALNNYFIEEVNIQITLR
jgi:hypothetical protein